MKIVGQDVQQQIHEEDDSTSLCSMFAGDESFGIDTGKIREVLGKRELERVPMAPPFVAGVVPYRGDVLTTVSFRALLGLPESDEAGCVLVLEDERRRRALWTVGRCGGRCGDGEPQDAGGESVHAGGEVQVAVRRSLQDAKRVDGATGSAEATSFAAGRDGNVQVGNDGGERMRALIVDDSSFIREYLRHLLDRMGIACEEAVDGSDALAVLTDEKEFDLMLLDVNMPVMNGLECVKALREAKLHPEMKVMMVTTEADNSFITRALDNGADEFLMKPFTPESLREKMMLLGFAA